MRPERKTSYEKKKIAKEKIEKFEYHLRTLSSSLLHSQYKRSQNRVSSRVMALNLRY